MTTGGIVTLLASGVLLLATLLVHGATDAELADATAQGVKKISERATLHLEYAKKLEAALASGDLEQAKAAYVSLRPYYEEVEVLCESFPDIDTDIDARPYAFVSGDASCGADDPFARGQVYQGNHMIEALLYRDGDLNKAKLYTAELVRDSQDLMKALQNSTNFYAARSLDGLIDLATEIGSKKISSEEETYSDQSVLIYYHNVAGMYHVYSPYSPLVQASNSSLAKAVADAFTRINATLLPFVAMSPQGQTFTPYSQLTNKQRANITAAAYNLAEQVMAAAVALNASKYAADVDDGESSAACSPDPVFKGDSPQVSAGLAYLRALNQYETMQVDALVKAINAGNLSAAQQAYNRSRPLYEQIEVLAPAFKTEDKEINARAHDYDFDGGEDPNFSGFHKIEQLLYRDGTLSGAQPAAAELQEAFGNLTSKLNDSSLFNGYVSFNGMNSLATSIPALSISSETETFSGLSYLVFYNNWKGIYSQLIPFLSQNSTLQAAMGAQVQKTFGDAFACLPIQTKDVWSDVSAANVTQASIDNLINANYSDFKAASNKIRACIFDKGFAVRDLVISVARMLGVTPSCDAIFLYKCGSATA